MPADSGPAWRPRIQHWAALGLVFNAFTWGVSWWPFRQLNDLGLHPLWVTTMAYSAIVVVLMVRRPQAIAEVLRTPPLWLLVAASGTTNATFNWAVTTGDVVRVVLLFYLMPLWTVLLSRLLLGERIATAGGLRVLLALAGAAVVLWPERGLLSLQGAPTLPDALALLGGFSFALNNVMLRREAAQSGASRALAMFAGGAVVSMLLAWLLHRAGLVPAPPVAPGPGLLLAIVAMALWFLLANLALQQGAAQLPANTTALIMVSEVVFASASAVALDAGRLGLPLLLGGALILAAALPWRWRRAAQPD